MSACVSSDASASCDPSCDPSAPSARSSSSGPADGVHSAAGPSADPAANQSSGPSSALSPEPSARTQAEKLHEALLLAQATSNLGRRKFIAALLALHESRLHLQLGSPSIEHYARRHFGIERSVTFEYLRVARALGDLPRCDEDVRIGRLTWSALREITKVATGESEEEWIAFARKYPGARLRGEVNEAVRKNRQKPRKDGYGLPGLETRLVFELKPEEQDLASKALEEVARDMSERLQGAEIEPKDAFLFLARRFLEHRVREDAEAGDPVASEMSLYTVLYHRCPDCRRAGVPTPEGLVEIDREVVDRVEGDARRVIIEVSEEEAPVGGGGPEPASPDPSDPAGEAPLPEHDSAPEEVESRTGKAEHEPPPAGIDRPNPPALVRKIRLRDGRACANPGCERTEGLHAHHIVERARGGATAVYNEVLLCSTCHSLTHAGHLRVEGNPIDGLEWTVSAGDLSTDLWTRLRELSAAPDIHGIERHGIERHGIERHGIERHGIERHGIERHGIERHGSAAVISGSTAVDPEEAVDPVARGSTAVDPRARPNKGPDTDPELTERRRYLERALRTLGFSAREAKRRLERAWESLGARASETPDGELVKTALRLHAA